MDRSIIEGKSIVKNQKDVTTIDMGGKRERRRKSLLFMQIWFARRSVCDRSSVHQERESCRNILLGRLKSFGAWRIHIWQRSYIDKSLGMCWYSIEHDRTFHHMTPSSTHSLKRGFQSSLFVRTFRAGLSTLFVSNLILTSVWSQSRQLGNIKTRRVIWLKRTYNRSSPSLFPWETCLSFDWCVFPPIISTPS
jgi:hypothetical protein